MKKLKSIISLLVIALMGLSLAACSEDSLDTNQFDGKVSLNVFGPSPVMRSGQAQLRFIGSNLDQVAQVIIPGCDPITNIEVVKAGTPSEIRVTVPKDGPEVGYVKLITKTDEVITTKTELTYVEGIEFEAFSPESVMPGETLTIKGEYFNLVKMLEFSDGVQISADDFLSQDRYTITVVVPETARTGVVSFYDKDLTKVPSDSLTDVSYNIVESSKVLNVGTPTVSKFASPRGEAELTGTVVAKMGETITVTGEYFNLVAGLSFGDAGEDGDGTIVELSDFTVSEDGKTITFVLPEEAPDGSLNLICRSGVEVPVGNIETVKPSNCVASPNPVKAGQPLTITGSDLDVVYAIEMPGVATDSVIAFTKAADGTSLTITSVPDIATEGNLVLRMKNGEGTEVAFTLVKPVVTSYGSATVSAGGVLTINGTDLDLVKSVQFGEGSDVVTELTVSEDGKSLTLKVPMNAASGKPTLTLANGTTVEGLELTVEEAVFCYATALPGEDVELKAGGTMTLTVANGDKLTGVEINGVTCQYVLTGDQLIIGIPDNAGKGSQVRLVSSNGEITYTLDITPNTEVNTVIWTGMVDLQDWAFNWQWGDNTHSTGEDPMAFANLTDLAPGDVLHIYVTPKGDDWQIQFFDGHWGGFTEIGESLFGKATNNVNGTGQEYTLSAEGSIDITLTAAIINKLQTLTDWGYCLIMQGQSLIVTKISVTHYNVLETTIWSGSWECSGWGGNQDLAWGGYDWTSVKAGSTLRLYYTKTVGETEWGCISLRHGTGWGNLPAPIESQYDFPDGTTGVYEVKLPQNVLTDIIDNGGLVITGDKYILTKVTIE